MALGGPADGAELLQLVLAARGRSRSWPRRSWCPRRACGPAAAGRSRPAPPRPPGGWRPRSRGCRRRPPRSPGRSCRRAAPRTPPRGCRPRAGGCGDRRSPGISVPPRPSSRSALRQLAEAGAAAPPAGRRRRSGRSRQTTSAPRRRRTRPGRRPRERRRALGGGDLGEVVDQEVGDGRRLSLPQLPASSPTRSRPAPAPRSRSQASTSLHSSGNGQARHRLAFDLRRGRRGPSAPAGGSRGRGRTCPRRARQQRRPAAARGRAGRGPRSRGACRG